MARNESLRAAKAAKNDEFYTQLHDIELELFEYMDEHGEYSQFKDKTVLCPCDDPANSNFTLFFAMNFERFGLKKLISTSYNKEGGKGRVFIVDHDITGDGIVNQDDIHSEELEGDGDFRSDEVKAFREEADIIVTNPPFSLFREFLKWINPDEKKFLILGNMNAITYKEVFPLIKDNKMWLGLCNPTQFETNTGEIKSVLTRWFTNLHNWKRNEPMDLVPMQMLLDAGCIDEYKKYDNYDAIEVPKCSLIPGDYTGMMGVPISFLDKYCPEQFEIVGTCENEDLDKLKTKVYTADERRNAYMNKFNKKGSYDLNRSCVLEINGILEQTYRRIFIRKKQ